MKIGYWYRVVKVQKYSTSTGLRLYITVKLRPAALRAQSGRGERDWVEQTLLEPRWR